MYVKTITGNTLTVSRAQNATQIATHANGTAINVINHYDDDLIPEGDDFGFSEYRYDYADGRVYSTTKGVDV